MKNNKEYDVIIAGSGLAGLFAALNLPESYKILIITKDTADLSDSFLAQGGICVQRDEDDYDSFMEDTMKAGHYENKREAVDVMIRESREVIQDLLAAGVEFDKNPSGDFAYTKEAAHSKARILHARDTTGQEICSKLTLRVRERANIEIMEGSRVVDILIYGDQCWGVVVRRPGQPPENILSKDVILATGGVGGLYPRSTNYPHLTGDALAIALRHGIRVKDMSFVQVHPTSLYTEKPGRAFLISEAVRGEGAILLDKKGNRFVDELLPRDQVTEAIYGQMEKDQMPYVMLCLAGHTSPALLHGGNRRGPLQPHLPGPPVCCGRNQLQRSSRTEPAGQQLPAGKSGLQQASSSGHSKALSGRNSSRLPDTRSRLL